MISDNQNFKKCDNFSLRKTLYEFKDLKLLSDEETKNEKHVQQLREYFESSDSLESENLSAGTQDEIDTNRFQGPQKFDMTFIDLCLLINHNLQVSQEIKQQKHLSFIQTQKLAQTSLKGQSQGSFMRICQKLVKILELSVQEKDLLLVFQYNQQIEHKLHYKECTFTKIYTDFMAQGGDIVKKDGTGSICIYGEHFKPEPIKHKHNERGLISMFNQGDGKLGCQFFFTFGDCTWVDGIHSVFGHIVDDMSILDDLELVSNSNGVPKKQVRIVDCGQLM
ncbi:hypothetical protein pb186bvf_015454 [Paramecium bursaria]